MTTAKPSRGSKLAAAVGALALGCAPVAQANVFANPAGADPRVETPRSALPPVGVVAVIDAATKKVFRAGTGFMVGPCHMMTAWHAANTNLQNPGFRFLVGAAQTPYRLQLVAKGEGAPATAEDWALLRVESCPGLRRDVGWMGVDARPWTQLLGRLVASASFPFEHGYETVRFESPCALRAGDPQRRIMAADCSASGGASGAPVFWLDGGGRPVAVGLVTAVMTPTPGLLPSWDQAHSTLVLSLAEAFSRNPKALDALVTDWRGRTNPLARAGVGVRAPIQPPRR